MSRTHLTCMVAVVGLMLPLPQAVAQGEAQPTDTRCWYASNSFTVGSNVRQGEQVLACKSDGSWAETDKASAGCLINGNLSGIGAIVGVTNGGGLLIECGADGRWVARAP